MTVTAFPESAEAFARPTGVVSPFLKALEYQFTSVLLRPGCLRTAADVPACAPTQAEWC